MKKYYDVEAIQALIPKEEASSVVEIKYLRPGQLLRAIERMPVAYLPMGTIEWHARHNPLGCDTIKAEKLCIATAEEIGGVVMPSLYFAADAYRDAGFGMGLGMDSNAGFLLPGSYHHIDAELLKRFLINACANYLERGFKAVVIISGHCCDYNTGTVNEVCYHFKDAEGAERVFFYADTQTVPDEDPHSYADHAGGYETSMMLYHCGEYVNFEANRREPETLGILSKLPWDGATAGYGEECFRLQVEGLKRIVLDIMAKLN